MKSLFTGVIFSLGFIVTQFAYSYEVIEVCATYLNSGKRYKVETSVFQGSELNKKTKSYDYNTYSKYAVIFWGPGQATVIELDYSYGGISAFGSTGNDQQGRKWELTTSTTFCY